MLHYQPFLKMRNALLMTPGPNTTDPNFVYTSSTLLSCHTLLSRHSRSSSFLSPTTLSAPIPILPVLRLTLHTSFQNRDLLCYTPFYSRSLRHIHGKVLILITVTLHISKHISDYLTSSSHSKRY